MATSTTIMPHPEPAEHLADVITLHCPVEGAAREYRCRVYDQEPNKTAQPLAHYEWVIEQRLYDLWDQGRDPHAGLAFLPAVVGGELDLSERAGVLLNALFVAADEVADETLEYGQPSMRAMDEQGSVLWDLANCLRGGAQ